MSIWMVPNRLECQIAGMKKGLDISAIAERLRLLREALEWSQTRAAKVAGVSLTTWNNYERGVSPIQWHVAMNFCNATGAKMDWIYRGERGAMPLDLMERIEAAPAREA